MSTSEQGKATPKTILGMARKPMVIAHRGFSGRAPENTMSAFRMALDAGVDMIEFDVQLSREREVVVIHDDKVDRTTDGSGKVSAMTLEELSRLDAGSWFNRSFAGEHIPTLREALELIAPKVYVNIEIKTDTVIRRADTEIADRTFELVKNMGLLNRVLFSSFNHMLMKYLKGVNPDVHTGVIFHPIMHAGRLPSGLAKPAGAEVFVCGKRDATKRRIENARKHDIIIGVYGLESQSDIDRMLDSGITVLVSDYPDKLIEALRRYGDRKAS